jgi:hypothetical protein
MKVTGVQKVIFLHSRDFHYPLSNVVIKQGC